MKTQTLVLALAVCSACGGSTPPPAAKPAATTPAGPRTEKEFNELLKRADAAVPKDAPDQQPAKTDEPAPVVIIEGPKASPRYRSSGGYSSASQPYGGDYRQPQQSEEEKMMLKAQYAFGGRVSNLSYMKQNLTRMKMQKEYSCTGKSGARPVNGDFPASATPIAQDNAGSSQCRSATINLEAEEAQYKRQFDALEIDAKRAGILPGVMRDLYSKMGFNPY